MKELFDAALMPVNVIPTTLLGLILVYWITVIFGALDMDFLNPEVGGAEMDVDVDADMDVEIDADVDADVDTDMDVDTDAGVSTSGVIISLNSILSFFNLGKVPFMLLLSFFILPLWIISILLNYYLHNHSVLLSLAFLIPNIIASLLISKILTTPFAFLYTRITKNNADTYSYVGKMCTLLMPVDELRFGQAEINNMGNIFRINVITNKGITLKKGDTALVINYIKEKKSYLVEPYKL